MNKEKILNVLMHCVGDHLQCPSCRYSFIPSTATQKEALELYNELKDDTENALYSSEWWEQRFKGQQGGDYIAPMEYSDSNLYKEYTKLQAELELTQKLLVAQKKETDLFKGQAKEYEKKVYKWFNKWKGLQK